jgi:hypothetical protein
MSEAKEMHGYHGDVVEHNYTTGVASRGWLQWYYNLAMLIMCVLVC